MEEFDESGDEVDGLPTGTVDGSGENESPRSRSYSPAASGSPAGEGVVRPAKSGSASPPVSGHSHSPSQSPARSGSGSASPAHSGMGSPARSDGGSVYGAADKQAASESHGSPPVNDGEGAGAGSPVRSRSGSLESNQSLSPTPDGAARIRSATPRSASASPVRSLSRSPARSKSGSPAQSRSRSVTPASRSASGSPVRNGSRSPRRSLPGSPARSRSVTPARSRSGSPARSRSGSPARSRSGSYARSGSGSPARSRSVSRSPSRGSSVHSRSRSGSRSPARSRSGSRARSQSAGSQRSGRSMASAASSTSVQRTSKSKRREQDVLASGSDAEQPANAEDLFGDADDISSVSSHGEGDRGEADMLGANEDEAEEEAPETRIEVEIPKINTDLGRQLHFVKLPNFLSVETRPFDAATYEDEVDDDEVMDEEGRTRLKLKVENTVRWRHARDERGNMLYDELGNQQKESNARVVRWSDGSLSLYLGNEIFDVHVMQLQGDFNHLFVRQGTGLQGQSVFKTKLTFRPHSTDSFTHRKMTLSLADRSNKAQKVKVLPIAGKDPDAQRSEMIKKEDERLRASIRRESQQRRMRERANQRGMSASYLEGNYDHDDDNAISLAAIKKRYKQETSKPARMNIYSSNSEDESSEDDERNRKRLLKAKKLDSDRESESDEETKKKKAKIVSDSDEEEAAEDS